MGLGGFRGALLGCVSAYALVSGPGMRPARAGGLTPLFSPAWFAQRGQTLAPSGGGLNAASPVVSNGMGVSPQALKKLQQSITDVTQAAQAITAAQAAQRRAAALVVPNTVPNGLILGGLRTATAAVAGATAWQGANLPTQAVVAGHTTVTIKQTSPQAVLTWQSYNVGQQTTVSYDQSAGGAAASTWVALNRVLNPNAQPSQILGSIKAPGQVYVIDANGIIFGATSQVNTGGLIASTADLAPAQFLKTGIYSTETGSTYTPSFTGASALSGVDVVAGAQITTNIPSSAVQAGGLVLLLGGHVQNGGTISAPDGQIAMAAGQDFILRSGFFVSTTASAPSFSTTRGTEVAVADKGGAVFNTGILQTTTGDITLVGHTVSQSGVAVSTTSVTQRGTIHLLTDQSDATAAVTLSPGSLTAILPDDAGATPALDSARDAAIVSSAFANGARTGLVNALNNQAGIADQQYESRVEITSGGTVTFTPGSLTLASGGQVAVSTGNTLGGTVGGTDRTLVQSGASIDVAGLLGVSLPMSDNQVEVNIQGFELRDAPVNRDTKTLNSSNVYVDIRQLVTIAASAAYPTTRLYTPGGLLEVSGEVGNTGHSIQEWSTDAGTVTLAGTTVVTQPGAMVNIAGGSIAYQAGVLKNSYLVGADGNIYDVNTAPGSLQYTGLYSGFTVSSPRWNVSQTYTSNIVDAATTAQAGYTVGRDAGTFVVSAKSTTLEGTIDAAVLTGPSQTALRGASYTLGSAASAAPVNNTPFLLAPLLTTLAPGAAVTASLGTATNAAPVDDPFQLAQDVVPLGGGLLIGSYNAQGLTTTAVGPATAAIADGTVKAAGLVSASQVTASGLATLSITAANSISVITPFTLAPGGQLTLTAANVTINGSITARAGTVSISNLVSPAVGTPTTLTYTNPLIPSPFAASITLDEFATIDTRGLWTNALLAPSDAPGEALVNGGNVSLISSGLVNLAPYSTIDTSSGGAITSAGKTIGGAGGNINLTAASGGGAVANGYLVLGGALRAGGVTHGGTLSIQTEGVVIGTPLTRKLAALFGTPYSPLVIGKLDLQPSFFQQGFSAYNVTGYGNLTDGNGNALPGITVTPGTDLEVTEPVYQFTSASFIAPTGTDPVAALSFVLPPLYLQDPVAAKLTQRAGASLVLSSVYGSGALGAPYSPAASGTNLNSTTPPAGGGDVLIAPHTIIHVDPQQSVLVQGYGQVTVDGSVTAHSGTISVLNDRIDLGLPTISGVNYVAGQSVWIGGTAVLDASAVPATALDTQGRPYGQVLSGGSVILGAAAVGNRSSQAELVSTDALVLVRPGALIEASGAAALIDPLAGKHAASGALSATADASLATGPVAVASNGGIISVSSYDAIFLDGTINAGAGGPGAAGGTLNVTFEQPVYFHPGTGISLPIIPDALRVADELIVEQAVTQSLIPAGLLPGDPSFFVGAGAGVIGKAVVSASQITAGGFGTVSLFARQALVFDGTVKLQASQSISLVANTIADTSTLGRVTVAAPYVYLGNAGPPSLANISDAVVDIGGSAANTQYSAATGGYFSKTYLPCLAGAPGACTAASLTVQGDLVDIQNNVRFGLNSIISLQALSPDGSNETTNLNLPGFNDVHINSVGDVRFLAETTATGTPQTDIATAGNLSFTAAQLYPVTGATAAAYAGVVAGSLAASYPQAVLTIAGTGTLPAAPLSVNASLTLNATTIVQGGIVRAPLGIVAFGQPGVTSTVQLLPGSITSVSADGETIPYGGTSDGINYLVDGKAVGVTGGLNYTPPVTNTAGGVTGLIQLSAQTIQVAAGATLDLSGGGLLAGGAGESVTAAADGSQTYASQGFISGRGGSTDTLYTPLVTFSPATRTVSAPAIQTAANPNGTAVYAILPSNNTGYAPATPYETASNYAGSVPGIGAQIFIPAGVPGLKAGAYTLLPSDDALLPGAFRVELDPGTAPLVSGTNALRNGSYQVNATTGVANTGIRTALTTVATITSGVVLRTYSQYDEEDYASFVTALTAQNNLTRPYLPQDAKSLLLDLAAPNAASTVDYPTHTAFSFAGTALFNPAAGGYGGTAAAFVSTVLSQLEITDGPTPTLGFTGVSLNAAALDALGASRIVVGGYLSASPAGSANSLAFTDVGSSASVLRDGATLRAPEVLLVGNTTLEPGAVVDTVGAGPAPFSAATNLFFTNSSNVGTGSSAVLAVSNGNPVFLAPGPGSDPIGFGVCLTGDVCSPIDTARIDSTGAIDFITTGAVTVGNAVRFGSAAVTFDVGTINVGSAATLASANVPAGVPLTQTTIDSLVAGDPRYGAPPLQSLTLAASQSLNFYGTAALSLTSGGSGGQLTLTTPAIYGFGTAKDVATLSTGTLTWNGGTGAPPVMLNGPGSGTGTLDIIANTIILGYPAQSQPQSQTTQARTVFGFGAVNLVASTQLTDTNNSALTVYQAQGPYSNTAGGFTGIGGTLTVTTPLVTGGPGSILALTAGGAVTVQAPAAGPAAAIGTGQGAEIDLTGTAVSLNTAVALPDGKLAATATTGDVTIGPFATLNLAGTPIKLLDQTVYSPGGTVQLTSAAGNVTVAAGSTIDVSATSAHAGSITAVAPAGTVSLAGALRGGGGAGGSIATTGAMSQAAFDALNQQLNANGFTASRSFDLTTGSFTIGTDATTGQAQLQAAAIDVSVDAGTLTVTGLVNASGAAPGSIRLASSGNLTLTSAAVLDAHGTVLQTDSSGQPIDATNTATITLGTSGGVLALQPGATFDLRAADGVARGDLELNVPRTGGVGIAAAGPLTIRGAATVALNAFQTYTPGTEGLLTGGVITQADINAIGADDAAFITGALADTGLQGRTAGLSAAGTAFHLRPGVEIDSSTASGGTLTVSGDLDLSGLRTHSAIAANDITTVLGTGEPGVLVLRAAGNLNVYGSVSDGFGTPPATPDDNGWVLPSNPAANVTVPASVPVPIVLASGTRYGTGATLNYDLALNGGTLNANATVPAVPAGSAPVTLTAAATISSAFVATGSITVAGGVSYTAGQTVPVGAVLPVGTVLSAGVALPVPVSIAPVTWPAGAALSAFAGPVSLATNVTLAAGDLIPGGSSLVFANGASSVNTRPTATVQDAAGDLVEGHIYALAPLLSSAAASWSLQLVAGANLGAADARTVLPKAVLALQASGANPTPGSILLTDPHVQNGSTQPVESVVRTGTGSLSLLAGGNITEGTLYGIYTAGHQAADVTAAYNLPQANLAGATSVLGAAGDTTVLNGATYNTAIAGYQAYYPTGGGNVLVSANGIITGNILAATTYGANASPSDSNAVSNWLYHQAGPGIGTAYWVNFGNYVLAGDLADVFQTGFTGIGALGGGNATVLAGVSASNVDIAVASTGRVSPTGSVEQTGGGNLTFAVNGPLNPSAGTGPTVTFGILSDLRGTLSLSASSIGQVLLSYGGTNLAQGETGNPFVAGEAFAAVGGPALALGDAKANLASRGDLVLSEVIDPTLQQPPSFLAAATAAGIAQTPPPLQDWFSLQTQATAVSLLSAGGNLSPRVTNVDTNEIYPPTLNAVAAQGSVYLGSIQNPNIGIELAPAARGELKLLAGGSIFDSGVVVSLSGADPLSTATLESPAYIGGTAVTNIPTAGNLTPGYLFAFGPDTPTTDLHAGDPAPAMFYAATGDIVGLQTGAVTPIALADGTATGVSGYVAAKAVEIEAARDIISLSTPTVGGSSISPSVFFNANPNDVSIISAGRDITYANVQVGGMGNLLVQAGRNFFQGDQGVLESIGTLVNVSPFSRSGGAGITVLAGVGATGPDDTAFANLYFNPANLANATTPLQQQVGKVVETYQAELLSYLQTNEGYTGSAAGALAAFQALPSAQQQLFALTVYFNELNLAGLEYNDPTSRFFKSYLRGNEAIAALFPKPSTGDITLYSGTQTVGGVSSVTGSGILTDFGGGITVVDPSGQIELGVATSVTPPATSGLITQGSGNIDIYSYGSLNLGQSRVFTTFGGGILIWSSHGNIAAGLGAKSTVVATPANISYDNYGNITLSPTVPSTGAGIATLAPIPSVPPGDINLVAPLGIIDAGEAGIRSSGNANLAALLVVNAANIQVQGKVTGLPVVAIPNIGALAAAGNASSAALNSSIAAQNQAGRQIAQPSVITVEVLGYGGP